MKKLYHLLALCLFLSSLPSSSFAIEEERPFEVSLSSDGIAKTEVKDGFGSHLEYGTSEFQAIYKHVVSPYEQLVYGIGTNYARLRFHQTSHFVTEHSFHTFNPTFGFKTDRVDNWDLSGYVTAKFDTQRGRISHNTLYRLTMQGRYAYNTGYNKGMGVHLGVIAQTGLRRDKMWPIIGVDYKVGEKWNVFAVYPIKASVQYLINDEWSVELAARQFLQRNRDGGDATDGFFEYQGRGLEIGANYNLNGRLTANLHVGATRCHKIRLSDNKDQGVQYLHLKPAAYFGLNLASTF